MHIYESTHVVSCVTMKNYANETEKYRKPSLMDWTAKFFT